MAFLEFDLAGADWVITAFLCQDENMLRVATGSVSPHVVTGSLMTGVPEALVEAENKIVGSEIDPAVIAELRKQLPELYTGNAQNLPRTMSIRQAGKKANHGLNYGMQFRRYALLNEIPETEAKQIVEAYTQRAYPGLANFWRDVQTQLRKNRTLTNCFGRKVRLLEEWGHELFQAAYSFIPQSTVADCVLAGMVAVYNDESPAMRPLQLAANVHDSMLVEYPSSDLEGMSNMCRAAIAAMQPELCYHNRTFKLRVDCKVGFNWGDMTPVKDMSPTGLERVLFGRKQEAA